MDDERERAIGEAFALYMDLRRLAQTLPRDHPAHPTIVAAIEAAQRHWRALATLPEDRVLAVVPARAR
jgi:hypothetical protein